MTKDKNSEEKFFEGFVDYYNKNVDELIEDVERVEFVRSGRNSYLLRVQSAITIYEHRSAIYNDFINFEKNFFKSEEWRRVVRDKNIKNNIARVQEIMLENYSRPYLADNLKGVEDKVKLAFDLYQRAYNEELEEVKEKFNEEIKVSVRLRPKQVFPEQYVKDKIDEFYDPAGDKERVRQEILKIAGPFESNGYTSVRDRIEVTNNEVFVDVLPVGNYYSKLKQNGYRSSYYLDIVKGRWPSFNFDKIAYNMSCNLLIQASESTEVYDYAKSLTREIDKAIERLIDDGEIDKPMIGSYTPMVRAKVYMTPNDNIYTSSEVKERYKEDRKREKARSSRGRKGSAFRRALRNL